MADPNAAWMQLLPQAGQQYGPDPTKQLNAGLLAQRLQQGNQQQQSQANAARLFQDPNNVGPNGFLKGPAIGQAIGSGAISLPLGMDLQEAASKAAQQQQVAAARQQEMDQKWRVGMNQAFRPATLTYLDTRQKTGSEEAAQRAGQAEFTRLRDEMLQSGNLTPEQRRQLEANSMFNPQQALANNLTVDQYLAGQRAEKADARADKRENREEKKDDAVETPKLFSVTESQPDGTTKTKQIMLGWSKTGGSGGRGTYVDDQGNTYGSDQVKPLSTAAAASDPEAIHALAQKVFDYDMAPPTSASMRAGGTGPLIMKEIADLEKEAGRKYDAKNFSAAKKLNDGYAATTPNSAGGQINAANTLVQHLDELKKLAAALKNHDPTMVNAVVNYVQTQLGHPEATNIQTAAPLIADETIKAAIGAGGGVADRAGMLKNLSDTKSPKQMEGAIDTITGLVGGRLKGMQQQWKATGLAPERWQDKLTPEAATAFGPMLGIKKSDDDGAVPAPARQPMPQPATAASPQPTGAPPAASARLPPPSPPAPGAQQPAAAPQQPASVAPTADDFKKAGGKKFLIDRQTGDTWELKPDGTIAKVR